MPAEIPDPLGLEERLPEWQASMPALGRGQASRPAAVDMAAIVRDTYVVVVAEDVEDDPYVFTVNGTKLWLGRVRACCGCGCFQLAVDTRRGWHQRVRGLQLPA